MMELATHCGIEAEAVGSRLRSSRSRFVLVTGRLGNVAADAVICNGIGARCIVSVCKSDSEALKRWPMVNELQECV